MSADSEKMRRKRLASLSFEEKVKNLEKLRERSKAIASAGLRKKKSTRKEKPDQLVQEIRELRKGATQGKTTVRELINDGRRY